MKLSEYPRPPADNGRGVHWSPSQYQWGRKDWLTWQKRILEMGFKWIKVNVPPDYNAEALVKRLVEIEVMPVCRFISKNPSRISSDVESSIARLVNLGARYFETNNEPDADVEWVGYKRPNGWETLVLRNLIYDAFRIQKLGGYPALVAFNVGPKESRNPIQILLQLRGGRQVLDQGMWISLHNYGKGRPFNYPNDRVRMFGDSITDEEWTNQHQPDSWTAEQLKREVWRGLSREHINQLRAKQKNPNITIHEDITCFRAYEYWNGLVTQTGLESLPIMMTEGGWETDDGIDSFYPQPTAVVASSLNRKMFQFIQGDIDMIIYKPDGSTESHPAPDYLFALMPWHMGERAFGLDTSGQWEQGAWFTHWHDKKYGLKGELPIAQMLRDLPSKVRVNGPVPPEWKQFQVTGNLNSVQALDYRLNYIPTKLHVEPVQTPDLGWHLTEVHWQDKHEILSTQPLPPGYIMVKLLDESGKPIPDAKVEIRRSDAVDVIMTKGRFDNHLGNYKMHAPLGTYTVRVLHRDHPSATITNLGLGGEHPDSEFDQTSFFLIFQLKQKATEEEPNNEITETTPTTPESKPVLEERPNIQPEQPEPSTPEPVQPEVPETPTPQPEPQLPPEPEPEPAINDAAHLGVTVLPLPPQLTYTVTKIHHYSPAERMTPNTLYLELLDQNGERQFRSIVLVRDASGQILRVPIEKPISEPGGNMPMFPGNSYEIIGVIVDGIERPTPGVKGLRATYPDHGEGHSFLVVLQLQ